MINNNLLTVTSTNGRGNGGFAAKENTRERGRRIRRRKRRKVYRKVPEPALNLRRIENYIQTFKRDGIVERLDGLQILARSGK